MSTAAPSIGDRLTITVDPDAEPLDLVRFLDALDALVEDRLQRQQWPEPSPN